MITLKLKGFKNKQQVWAVRHVLSFSLVMTYLLEILYYKCKYCISHYLLLICGDRYQWAALRSPACGAAGLAQSDFLTPTSECSQTHMSYFRS